MKKTADFVMDPADIRERVPRGHLGRSAGLAAGSFNGMSDTHGNYALAGFGSAKGSNEEAYLFQKLVRTGFGRTTSTTAPGCAMPLRLRRCSRALARAAVSNQVSDVMNAEVVLVIGANPDRQPSGGGYLDQERGQAGTKLIVADPRRNELHRNAWHYLQFKPDTDVALLNAMMHTIVDEGLVDRSLHRRPHQRLRGAARQRPGLQRPR